MQFRRAYRYTLTQSVRHGICRDWRLYPHTHVNVELEPGLRRALELNAFLPSVPYKRYQRGRVPEAPGIILNWDESQIPDIPDVE